MIEAPYQYSRYEYRASLRSRATAIFVAVALTALLLLMLIEAGAIPLLSPKVEQALVALSLQPEKRIGVHSLKIAPVKHAGGGSAKRRPTPTTPATKPTAKPTPVPWNVIPMTSQEFAQSDISTKASISGNGGNSGGGKGTGDDSGDASGNGAGPGGERLYNAEWYIRPKEHELDPYLPHGVSPGEWGEVACKMLPQFRVEDCRELAASPGSDLARALRQAAPNFRVLPPRIGGRPQIGVWVRIHWEIVPEGTAKE